MNKALIIIDMQPFFNYNGVIDKIISNCRREIQDAIKENIPVVFLEWADVGATDARLRELVTSYEHLKTITKLSDDGSNEIIAELGRFKYDLFKICGVNTDACVMATVRGLVNWCPNSYIEIVKDAVNTNWNQETALLQMQNIARVRVTSPA